LYFYGSATLGFALLLASCATQPVTLRHPQTGQTAQCGPYTNMHPLIPALSPHWKAERDCIGDFQRQGFERVPDTR
jgi:hypothetical protein